MVILFIIFISPIYLTTFALAMQMNTVPAGLACLTISTSFLSSGVMGGGKRIAGDDVADVLPYHGKIAVDGDGIGLLGGFRRVAEKKSSRRVERRGKAQHERPRCRKKICRKPFHYEHEYSIRCIWMQ